MEGKLQYQGPDYLVRCIVTLMTVRIERGWIWGRFGLFYSFTGITRGDGPAATGSTVVKVDLACGSQVTFGTCVPG